jgi:hypothetical protein
MAWHQDYGSTTILGPSPKELRRKPRRNCRKEVKNMLRLLPLADNPDFGGEGMSIPYHCITLVRFSLNGKRVKGQVPPPPDQFCATTSRSVRGNLNPDQIETRSFSSNSGSSSNLGQSRSIRAIGSWLIRSMKA